MREVRASQASEVLNARIVGPRLHSVDNHLDGARLEYDGAIFLLHGQVPQRAEAVGLDAGMVQVLLQARDAGLHAVGPGHLHPVVLVQGQVGDGGAALLPHFGVLHVVPHPVDHQRNAALAAYRHAGGLPLRHVREGAAALPLDARLRLVPLQRLADHGNAPSRDDGLLQELQPREDGHHLAARLLDADVVHQGAHRRDNQLQEVAAHVLDVVWRDRAVAQRDEGLEAIIEEAAVLGKLHDRGHD
mmetsp:Transcript_56115/g.151342  ORF Transcript_56115/g.151342 Transcript_56115/m.151342 type:complete len:245 (-) Transcript_56115:300-1034(-)